MEGPRPEGMDGAGSLMCVEAGFKAQIKGMLLQMALEFHYSPSSPHMLSDMDCSALSIKEKEQRTRLCYHSSVTSEDLLPNIT